MSVAPYLVTAAAHLPKPRDLGRLPLDGGRLDTALAGGLALAACHEIYGPGATAFALMLALACPRTGPILWVADGWEDNGRLHGAGLAELGGDPGRLWLVAAPAGSAGVVPMLRAAGEAQRCAALGCLVIESHGDAKAIDLTVTRRLQLAAATHGVFTLLLRSGQPRPSAASTRWQADPAPARRLAAGAPGPPRLAITLTRQRGGPADITQMLEWNRDRCSFIAAERRTPITDFAIPIGAAFARQPPHIGSGAAVVAGRTPGTGAVERVGRSAA